MKSGFGLLLIAAGAVLAYSYFRKDQNEVTPAATPFMGGGSPSILNVEPDSPGASADPLTVYTTGQTYAHPIAPLPLPSGLRQVRAFTVELDPASIGGSFE